MTRCKNGLGLLVVMLAVASCGGDGTRRDEGPSAAEPDVDDDAGTPRGGGGALPPPRDAGSRTPSQGEGNDGQNRSAACRSASPSPAPLYPDVSCSSLATSGDAIYWGKIGAALSADGGGVTRGDLHGSPATNLAEGGNVAALGISAGHVYFGYASLRRVPESGGTVSEVERSDVGAELQQMWKQRGQLFLLSGTFACLTARSRIHRLVDGEARLLVRGGRCIVAVAHDEQDIYWVEAEDPDQPPFAIYRVSADAGSKGALLYELSEPVRQLAVLGDDLIVFGDRAAGARLIPKHGGGDLDAAPAISGSVGVDVDIVRSDGSVVYAVELNSSCGLVHRIQLGSERMEAVASMPLAPLGTFANTALALGDRHVFVSLGSGIYALPR